MAPISGKPDKEAVIRLIKLRISMSGSVKLARLRGSTPGHDLYRLYRKRSQRLQAWRFYHNSRSQRQIAEALGVHEGRSANAGEQGQ
jgi:hypothetical protein